MRTAADETPTDDANVQPFRVARWKRRIFGAVVLLLAGLLVFAWGQRNSIADRFVQNAFAARGVTATYKIDTIGFRTQRIRDLVIGNPARPDLTAKLVEIDVALNFSGVNLRDMRADGVMLRGRYANGQLSFGELDKFVDPKSIEPLELPDIALSLKNARAQIETPWGIFDAAAHGSGLLRNRFAANLSVRSPRVAAADCTASDVTFDGKLMLEWREPHLVGPIAATAAKCADAGIAIAAPRLDANIHLSERFNRWEGALGYAAAKLANAQAQMKNIAGKLSVDGDLRRTNFALLLDKAALRSAPLSVGRLRLDSRGYAGLVNGRLALSVSGNAALANGALDGGTVGDLRGLVAQTRATPIGPVVARIAPVLQRAGDRFAAQLSFESFQDFQGRLGGNISALSLTSASGVRLRQIGRFGVSASPKGWRLNAPAQLTLSGANLPDTQLSLAQTGQSWSGNLAIAPYRAGSARLAVSKLAFNGNPGGAWRFQGQAKMSGPLPGGFVTGLNLPIAGRYEAGALSLYDACQNVRFDSLKMASLALRGEALRLCPDRGRSMFSIASGNAAFATNIADFRASGNLGRTPISGRSATVRFSLDEGFAAKDVSITLGAAGAQSAFDVAALSGRFGQDGISGALSGGAGQIGNVPLLMNEASGDWRYADSILTLNGRLGVTDAEQVDRFVPMIAPDMQLTLENDIITAIGHVVEPTTGTRVADVDIRHALGSATGRALLAVNDLRFTERFQPDLLTPLVLGVAANVDGTISGDGRIEWDPQCVRSTGKVATRGMNLAAAFGPVEGLTTEIVFTDLLGLQTGPAQVAEIASVNPGVPALGGKVSYRLLPNQRVAIESGRWPFAGGELILEPTILDFEVESERHLTFRVIGMHADKLLEGYDFQNLRVTGVFDGTLPMIFNQDGGRIVGGSLVSREGGGEVSYLGELTYKDMGVFANYAFNALRSIRYSTLTIGVGGDLDGEIVTDISFTGLQQGSLAKRNFITRQLARIPIKFNVSVTAEFMKLIGSVRGYYDPNYAAERDLPYLLKQQRTQTDAKTSSPVEPTKETANE
jgi:translocation and assembly module TamB